MKTIFPKATNHQIAALESGAKRRLVSDSTTANLYLCIEPTGSRAWKYDAAGLKGRGRIKITLGKFPHYSARDAREWAAQLNRERGRGLDPRDQIAQRAADERAKVQFTLAKVWDLWLIHKRQAKEAVRSLEFYDKLLRRNALPWFGDKPVAEMTKGDCRELVTRIRQRGAIVTANMTLALLKSFFHWCAEFDYVEHNPAVSLRQTKHVAKGSRALELEELALAYTAAEQLSDDDRDAIRLLILTGARRWEVLGAAISEYQNGVFEIPIGRSKSKRPHPLTLSSLGRPIFESRCGREFAFCRNRPISRMNYGLADKLLVAMRKAAPEIAPFTLHGIRKGVRTALNSDEMHALVGAGGLPTDVCERVLNHAKTGMLGVYNKARDTRLIADALAAWEKLLIEQILRLDIKLAGVVPAQIKT